MASFLLSGSVGINWELSPGEKLTDRVWAVTDGANFLACMLTTPTVSEGGGLEDEDGRFALNL